MPRYFIDTNDGDLYARDDEGSDLPDLDAARREAVTALPEIAKCSLSRGNHQPVIARVRNEKGAVLFQAALTLSEEWEGDALP